jgi:predicted  nucleic acid-binding Zn-ribbon protein
VTAVPDPTTSIAVELEKLRGEISTGLENIKGTLNILVERTQRTDAELAKLRTEVEKELDELRTEVEALKKNRWPLAQIGALVGVGGLIAAVVALFVN